MCPSVSVFFNRLFNLKYIILAILAALFLLKAPETLADGRQAMDGSTASTKSDRQQAKEYRGQAHDGLNLRGLTRGQKAKAKNFLTLTGNRPELRAV